MIGSLESGFEYGQRADEKTTYRSSMINYDSCLLLMFLRIKSATNDDDKLFIGHLLTKNFTCLGRYW